MSNEDVSAGLAVYSGIIKRLLAGWVPNHNSGKPIHEWWHPHIPVDFLEPMSHAEFLILSELEKELDQEALNGRK